VRSAFVVQLRNSFQALADMEDHTYPDTDVINDRREHEKKGYLKTSEKKRKGSNG